MDVYFSVSLMRTVLVYLYTFKSLEGKKFWDVLSFTGEMYI